MRKKDSLLVALCCLCFASPLMPGCKKTDRFIDESIVGKGVHAYPEIFNKRFVDTLTDELISNVKFDMGDTLVFEIDFFSRSSIKEINLYATPDGQAKKLIQNRPYSDASFSDYKQTDSIYFSYIIPDSLASGSRIQLDVEVKNTNTLASIRTDYILLY